MRLTRILGTLFIGVLAASGRVLANTENKESVSCDLMPKGDFVKSNDGSRLTIGNSGRIDYFTGNGRYPGVFTQVPSYLLECTKDSTDTLVMKNKVEGSSMLNHLTVKTSLENPYSIEVKGQFGVDNSPSGARPADISGTYKRPGM
jgi:hypothetical protein